MAEEYNEIVIDEKSVINTIRTLIHSRTICKMEIPGTQHRWITMLLDIQSKKDPLNKKDTYCLSVDKVPGFDKLIATIPEKYVAVECSDNEGVFCQFQTQVIENRPGDILLEIPDSIQRIQKRQYFRVEAPPGTEMTFNLSSFKEIKSANVKDYSPGGVAFFMEKDSKLKIDDIVRNIHLKIPKKKEVVHFHIPQARVTKIVPAFFEEKGFCALKFSDIPEETKKDLYAHIFHEEKVLVHPSKR